MLGIWMYFWNDPWNPVPPGVITSLASRYRRGYRQNWYN